MVALVFEGARFFDRQGEIRDRRSGTNKYLSGDRHVLGDFDVLDLVEILVFNRRSKNSKRKLNGWILDRHPQWRPTVPVECAITFLNVHTCTDWEERSQLFCHHPLVGNPTGYSIRAAQPITDPGFGQDELRAFVVGFNFLSELPNKDPQILRVDKVVPEFLE